MGLRQVWLSSHRILAFEGRSVELTTRQVAKVPVKSTVVFDVSGEESCHVSLGRERKVYIPYICYVVCA